MSSSDGWMARLLSFYQEENKLQRHVCESGENHSEADVTQEVASPIVPTEHDKESLELESDPKGAPHAMMIFSVARYQILRQLLLTDEILRLSERSIGQRSLNPELCKRDSVGGDPRGKRLRSPDWSDEEKGAYLDLKVEALRAVKGKDWDFISQGLRERHGFNRSSKCCEDFWYTLLKSYRAIRDHESSNGDPVASKPISYWDMDEDERSKKKLPESFSLDWCKKIERILAAKEKRSETMSRGSIPVQELFAHEDGGQYSSQHPQLGERPRMPDQAELPNWEYAGREGVSAIPEQLLVQQQLDDAFHSALQRLRFGKRLGATTEEDDLTTMLATFVKQEVQGAIITLIDKDDLMTRLAPFFKKHTEDALELLLGPIASGLQVREREEQEYQEKLRTLADKRRALDLEEEQIKRQRVGRHRRTRKTSYKQQGRRVKKSSAERVIPG